ncbi:hypothetical protein ASE30_13840 [Achromobacter sp. Root83]|uniref:CHAT domain-containing protein n=1 Tax=Achromobacter sp. Root83 TaxID=1736602 RepID=UPI00070D5785|nr:CHAT domain-containing protein [Achromobacter sp. Root83]KRC71834.1 hypothetical protein ASE30_13840 [Achromobacter sp. Root83]
MEQPATGTNAILLVSMNDEHEDDWATNLAQLHRHVQQYPAIAPFVGARLSRRTTLESAKALLERWEQSDPPIEPRLAIIDARLGSANKRGKPGAAAVELLEWIAKRSNLPVLVLAVDPPEIVQRYVLERPEVFMWTSDPSNVSNSGAEVAIVLTCLTPLAPKRRRRLIIRVGEHSITYRMQMGRHEYSSQDMPYKERDRISALVGRIETFSPYSGETKAPQWLKDLSGVGEDVFSAMVTHSLGAPIAKLIQRARDEEVSPGAGAFAGLDLRFEFNLASQEVSRLFNLPFEMGREFGADSGRYLCLELPMARRLHLEGTAPALRWEQDARAPGQPVRLLFMDASSVYGTVSFRREDGGPALPATEFGPLRSVAKERQHLRDLAAQAPGHLHIDDVRDQQESALVGAELQKRIEERLKTGNYDIFHFAGHSVSLGDSTMLVLPGEDGEGWQLSIRLIGQWMEAGKCKLLVLSSCSGASVRTALEVMRAGAAGVLAFRWQVEEESCALYIERFYDVYLDAAQPKGLAEAYRYACKAAQGDAGDLPTWASAMAIVRD